MKSKKIEYAGANILYDTTILLLRRQNINIVADLRLYLKHNSINSFLMFTGWNLRALRNLEAVCFVESIEYYYN